MTTEELKLEALKSERRMHLVKMGIFPEFEMGEWVISYTGCTPGANAALSLEEWWDRVWPTMEEAMDATWDFLLSKRIIEDSPKWAYLKEEEREP